MINLLSRSCICLLTISAKLLGELPINCIQNACARRRIVTTDCGLSSSWSYMFYQLATYYLTDIRNTTSLWGYLGTTVVIFQNAAVLEVSTIMKMHFGHLFRPATTIANIRFAQQIVHAATGIVPSNVVLTTFQVFSRVMLVCGVLLATPNAIYSPGLPLALLAWSITEIIRYGFYGFNLLGLVPKVLTFLR